MSGALTFPRCSTWPRIDTASPGLRRDTMATCLRYRTKAHCLVVAVQFDLDTDGFTCRKWGAEHRCKRGDWLVDNQKSTNTEAVPWRAPSSSVRSERRPTRQERRLTS